MRTAGIVATTLASVAIATSAVAQEPQGSASGLFAGHDLYELATSNDNMESLLFVYYVAGVLEASGLFRAVEAGRYPNPVIPVCQPTGSNSMQAADIVKKYLLDHPEKRHIAAVVLVVLALQDGFPCAAQDGVSK